VLPSTETINLITIKSFYPRSNKPNNDIQVTLTLMSNAEITAAGLTPMPAGSYTIPSLTLTVPKATGEVKVPVTINKSLLSLTNTYGLGFRITSVSEGVISALANEIIVAMLVKNAYHADYAVNGFFFHPSAPRPISMTKDLATVGAVRSQAQVGDLTGWEFQFDVSGTNLTNWSSAFPGTPPVPPASGFMTTDNPGGIDFSSSAPNNPGTPPWTHATYNNTYNPATQTFYMHYGYGVGSTGPNGWTRQIYERWVRL